MAVKILVMGVSGSGKTSLGTALSQFYAVPLIEGDDYHPPANIEKMSFGQPLNDQDRQPWLESLAAEMLKLNDTGYIVASSALKEQYRNVLKADGQNNFEIIYLKGDKNIIFRRMEKRSDHFMPPSLLNSQYDALQPPADAIIVDITLSLSEQVSYVVGELNKKLKSKRENMTPVDQKADIAVIGLGVMGKALVRNFAGKNFKVAIYNAPLPGEENVMYDFYNDYKELKLIPCEDLQHLTSSQSSPRKILMMVKAGEPVDVVINQILPYLDEGDILIDAGNSFYRDTVRREQQCKDNGVQYVGMGVSGGEEGALNGPSMMPGGDIDIKRHLLPMLEKVAATADDRPCVGWIGTGGSGHFVKMIHNGIEYADMQILSEVYGVLKYGYGKANPEIAHILESWKPTPHNSYLLDITIDILRKKESSEYVIDKILDVAGHKGTGLWTSQESLRLGVAVPSIVSAMHQRILSSEKTLRERVGNIPVPHSLDVEQEELMNGILFCRLIALVEGFHIITKSAKESGWKISLPEITSVWRGGCIIRSDMLLMVKKAVIEKADLMHLFESPYFFDRMSALYDSANKMLTNISQFRVATPAISAAINYYKSMTAAYLPINLIQAQRDYFGAHTYRTLDDRDTPVHTLWK